MTAGEFMAANLEDRRAFARELLAQWEQNYRNRAQRDMEADRRAFLRGTIDAPGPIDEYLGRQSSTNRSASP